MTHTRMCQECPVSLEKLSFFFIQVKIIQVLVFDNWHPLNQLCSRLLKRAVVISEDLFLYKRDKVLSVPDLDRTKTRVTPCISQSPTDRMRT